MPLAKNLNPTGHFQPLTVYEVPIPTLADNSETDSTFDLPDEGIVEDVVLIVDTPEATATAKTLDVGILASESGGDADGFLDGISVATAGMLQGSLVNAGVTKGAFNRVVSGEAGEHANKGYPLDGTAKSVSFTFGDAAGATELVGRVLFYIRHDPENYFQVS